MLNSSLIQSLKIAPEEAAKQEAWLVDQLKRARAEKVENVIVFQHIFCFLESPDEPDQYLNIPTPTRKKYLALFHDYGVKHVRVVHCCASRISRPLKPTREPAFTAGSAIEEDWGDGRGEENGTPAFTSPRPVAANPSSARIIRCASERSM